MPWIYNQRKFRYHQTDLPFLYFNPIVTTTGAQSVKDISATPVSTQIIYIWLPGQRQVLNKAVEKRTYGIGIVLENQTS
jgi:hypothetical protein